MLCVTDVILATEGLGGSEAVTIRYLSDVEALRMQSVNHLSVNTADPVVTVSSVGLLGDYG